MSTTSAASSPQVFREHHPRSLAARFIADWIIQTKGRWAGKRLTLEDWQPTFLDELYLVDAQRRRVYREALLGLPRKNGKSTLAAGVALHGLMCTDDSSPEVYAAAGSRDQARIVFNQARDFVEASPRLRDWLKVQRNAILCPSNGGVFRVLSSDAPLQHGLNPSLVVIDELWAHRDPELYYALTTGQLARLDPLIVSITTAGWDRASIAWQVYKYGLTLQEQGIDAMREAGFLFKWFAAPDGCDHRDPKFWKTANPSSWIDERELSRECRRLPENVFRRLHLNQWTETEDAWITPAAWDACRGTPVINPDEPVWVGFDLGIKRDSTAIVWAQWHGDDLHIGQHIILPSEETNFGVSDAREALAADIQPLNALEEVAYDPWGFRESAETLEERGVPMVEFNQGNNGLMGPASEQTYGLIASKRLVHDGNPLMREQVLAAVAGATERGWRVSKRKSNERIDGCVALVMAGERALASRLEPTYTRAAW